MLTDEVLSRAAVAEQLKSLKHWQLDPEEPVITGRFEFDSFPAAVQFVNRIAGAAEALNHHPDIDIRYRKVTLKLTTHRVDGLTEVDLQLAEQVEELV